MLNTPTYFRLNYKGEGDLINDIHEGKIYAHDLNENIIQGLQIPDVHMFCTSKALVDPETVKKGFDAQYQSCYSIKNIYDFEDELRRCFANQFLKRLKYLDLNPNLRHEVDYAIDQKGLKFFNLFKSHLECNLFSCEIKYTKHLSTPIDDFRNANALIPATCFTKHPQYESQKEYRTILFFKYKLPFEQVKIFNFVRTGFLITMENILDFVEPC